ncbi:LPXTG cell wall anchor domain-containing protein [Carbonactinospora thermoautotrophica]|uniref:LPXTG cell wall anchor domain-containing protein n=1 Tax=Carbonactinospora thermoautotrophica TaxID=1469144 RepID=UPI00226DB682|nr:LPXTG cell wall anchor domain-containing protein [Carbonactinospora thermoautotrophica]
MKLSTALGTVLLVPALAVAAIAAPAAGTVVTTSPDTTASPDPTGTPTDTPTDTPTGTPTDTPTETASTTPTETATTSPPASTTPTETPTDSPTPTPSSTTTPPAESPIEAAITGLPGKLTAGRTYTFAVSFKNPTSEAINLGAIVGFGFDGLRKKDVRLEVRHGGEWVKAPLEGIEDGELDGLVFGPVNEEPVELAAGATRSWDLRVTFLTDGPRGEGLAALWGFDVQNDEDVELVAEAYQRLELVGKTGQQDPGKKWDKDKDDVSQNVDEVKDKALAQTGANDSLVLVGAVGAALVVAGGAALFAVRRRRSTPAQS